MLKISKGSKGQAMQAQNKSSLNTTTKKSKKLKDHVCIIHDAVGLTIITKGYHNIWTEHVCL